MLVLLAGIFVVHIATVIMLFISTISNVWIKTQSDYSEGIWKQCGPNGECYAIPNIEGNESALKAVQAFMILAIIFSVIALAAFTGQLFTLEKGCRFYVTGAMMFVCWICVLIAVSIYTQRFSHRPIQNVETYHAYCFILAWICFCFSFLTGILYFVLRKK
ncbi:epithelial membrane protein 1 [Microcaecilia unicolor]|uniref:Epithelial membrane protein 1 n=1 Tax=Microcaecilia unicolor TaxID=1415580 RepID=A0A6P7YDM2_9AMPH|nr:epithelial membrane protein 1 [Microcaecilia unicolor]